MKKQIEPFWWTWFSIGGTVSAFLLPVLMVIFGILIPLGWIEAPAHEHLLGLTEPIISRIVLFGIILVSLLHWAHRFRFTLYDGLQLKNLNQLIAVLCYGSALALSAYAGFILWNL